MEDDYVCEYDSTWETESDGEEQTVGRPTRRQDKNKPWALVRTPSVLFLNQIEGLSSCQVSDHGPVR